MEQFMQISQSITQQKMAWSLAEIAEATGLSLNFLRYEERRGNIQSVRFGRRVLILNDEMRRYLTEGSVGGQSRDSGLPNE